MILNAEEYSISARSISHRASVVSPRRKRESPSAMPCMRFKNDLLDEAASYWLAHHIDVLGTKAVSMSLPCHVDSTKSNRPKEPRVEPLAFGRTHSFPLMRMFDYIHVSSCYATHTLVRKERRNPRHESARYKATHHYRQRERAPMLSLAAAPARSTFPLAARGSPLDPTPDP